MAGRACWAAALVARNVCLMAEGRACEQCGALFVPRREHARFCSARCRMAWNRRDASGWRAGEGALDWSAAAMQETTDRLLRAKDWARPQAFAAISEAVWWVTMVDATLVRYHADVYDGVLAACGAAERPVIEGTFGGLRFVRNRMGYYADHSDFICPLDGGGAVAAWTWRPLAPPDLAALAPGGQEWEMRRYRAYQAELAGHSVGEAFARAAAFLGRACQVCAGSG